MGLVRWWAWDSSRSPPVRSREGHAASGDRRADKGLCFAGGSDFELAIPTLPKRSYSDSGGTVPVRGKRFRIRCWAPIHRFLEDPVPLIEGPGIRFRHPSPTRSVSRRDPSTLGAAEGGSCGSLFRSPAARLDRGGLWDPRDLISRRPLGRRSCSGGCWSAFKNRRESPGAAPSRRPARLTGGFSG